MHILEKYALSSGAKIGKPFIYEKYFPLKTRDYITFHAGEHQSKIYSHWCEVLDLIYPALKQLGISIIQIGGKKDKAYDYCDLTLGKTSFSQTAYILKNSKLHFGIDSFASQMAASYDKKVVCVFSHVLPEHKKPYWGDSENIALFKPELEEGQKPSYSYYEGSDKNIDKIKPEEIASKILSFLGIGFEYDFSTKYIGPEYDKHYVDIVPNATQNHYRANFSLARIRMDMEFNLQGLVENLNEGQQFVIITNKPIDIEILSKYKKKIGSLIFNFDEETEDLTNTGYISNLVSLGLPNSSFVCFDEEKSKELKLEYMDDILIFSQKYTTKENSKLEDFNDLYFKSSKRILSKGKYYPSSYHYREDISLPSFSKSPLPIVDDPEFWKDLNYFSLIKKLDK